MFICACVLALELWHTNLLTMTIILINSFRLQFTIWLTWLLASLYRPPLSLSLPTYVHMYSTPNGQSTIPEAYIPTMLIDEDDFLRPRWSELFINSFGAVLSHDLQLSAVLSDKERRQLADHVLCLTGSISLISTMPGWQSRLCDV